MDTFTVHAQGIFNIRQLFFEYMSEEGKSDKRERKGNHGVKAIISDFGSFIIAIVVVGSFVYFTAITISPKTPEAFKDIAAIWGVWVGSVIGYYFGSRQVENVAKRINDLLNDLDFTHEEYEEELDDAEEELDKLKQSYDDAKKELQYIAAKYQQQLDSALLERLKNEHGIRI
jgi:uncharacterized membrane-anchored protein YhcB (DUF1043 family)